MYIISSQVNTLLLILPTSIHLSFLFQCYKNHYFGFLTYILNISLRAVLNLHITTLSAYAQASYTYIQHDQVFLSLLQMVMSVKNKIQELQL